ncbi:MAG TPA: hypothetical protein VFV87_03920, partial [Pirellulaceae bacterium]|nr:hypothetical protein [Pirellulaceae bacterium]
MRFFSRLGLVSAGLWAICVTGAVGAGPSEQQLREWAAQLDAEDYDVREEATRNLTAAAEAGIDVLADVADSNSPEVAWRASEALQEIAIAGNETTLDRVVAALDRLSRTGKPGLTNIARELRAKQVRLRHDRAASKIRSFGGKLAGGGAFASDGMVVEVIPELDMVIGGEVPLEIIEEVRVVEAREEVERIAVAEAPPAKPVALRALDEALKRLSDLLPAGGEEELKPEEPRAEDRQTDEPPPPPPTEDISEPAPPRDLPQFPAIDAAPAEEPAPPPAEAPIAEFEEVPLSLEVAGGIEIVEGEADVAIADAMVVDAGFFGGFFGGGFFVEESLDLDGNPGLSTSLLLDKDWHGGDEGLAALRDLPTLYNLSIADAKLTDAALEHIAALPNLHDLSVVNTKFSFEAFEKFRQQRPNTRIFARANAMLGIHADLSGACVLTGICAG